MIQHIVLIKFKAKISEAVISKLWQELRAIKKEVRGVLNIAAGKSESPEKIERGYLHGFVIEFDDWDALDRYQNHPSHKALAAKLVANAQGGLDGILVFDLPSTKTEIIGN